MNVIRTNQFLLLAMLQRKQDRELNERAVHVEEMKRISTICNLQPPSGIYCHRRSLSKELCPDFLRKLEKLVLNNDVHSHASWCNRIDSKSSYFKMQTSRLGWSVKQ